MSDVAVVGAGAIGGYLAALLAGSGHHVTLCVRTPIERLEVERDGEARVVPVEIATDPDGLAPVDWLVVATKAQDTAGAAPWLAAMARPRTVVVVAQNGIGHEARVAPLAPRSAILPALVHITVEPYGRGRVRHSQGNRIVVPAGPAGERFARLLAPSGVEVEREAGFAEAVWRKLLGNLVTNPITALTLRRAEVLHEPAIERLARTILTEAVAVARVEGVRLGEPDVEATLASLQALPPDNGTSMLFDRLAGRPLEHEPIIGALVETARRHGIPVPANEAMLALVAHSSGP